MDDRKRYSDTLNSQVHYQTKRGNKNINHYSFQIHEKVDYNQRNRQFDEEQQKRHYESWDSFWGRPGYGAPKHGAPSKGNLMKMLHYPDKVRDMSFCQALVPNPQSQNLLDPFPNKFK